MEHSYPAGFLSDSLVRKSNTLSPNMTGVLTYLVNGIENKSENNQNELIPYSMISAIEPGKVKFLDKGWKDDQIALNQWAANDLNASLGDSITVSFYTVGERRKLIESSREFVLGKILPLPTPVPDNQESEWTPRFPGLSEAESCGEWDTGIPIVHEVRDQDEDYWDRYRGTPKGFISLNAGRKCGAIDGDHLLVYEWIRGVLKRELITRLRKELQAEDPVLFFSLRSDEKIS